MLYLVIIV